MHGREGVEILHLMAQNRRCSVGVKLSRHCRTQNRPQFYNPGCARGAEGPLSEIRRF